MDFTTEEINYLLNLSAKLKADKYAGIFSKNLLNKKYCFDI